MDCVPKEVACKLVEKEIVGTTIDDNETTTEDTGAERHTAEMKEDISDVPKEESCEVEDKGKIAGSIHHEEWWH